MTRETESVRKDIGWSSRSHLAWGWLTIGAMALGIGGWGTLTEISSAVVAPGSVEVQGNRQVVQHLSGGVIKAIHVRDGDKVREGDVLVELDGELLAAEYGIVDGQWTELVARRSRLKAESSGAKTIAFPPTLLDRADEPAIRDLLAAQEAQFAARCRVHADELALLDERKTQIEEQIRGLEARMTSTTEEMVVVAAAVTRQEDLFSKGLSAIDRLNVEQRELARLRGTEGETASAISEFRAKMVETDLERVRLVSARQEAAIAELRETEFREIELRERRQSLLERIRHLALVAPANGTVYDSRADTLRAVVAPGEAVLQIVPEDAPLIVRTNVEPHHIDQVSLGQEALLRFSAFDARTTPEGAGEVIARSADAIEDPQTRARYYRIDIRIDEETKEKLSDLALIPGMPVEAFIQTGSRSPISYLVKPLGDYLLRAFRES